VAPCCGFIGAAPLEPLLLEPLLPMAPPELPPLEPPLMPPPLEPLPMVLPPLEPPLPPEPPVAGLCAMAATLNDKAAAATVPNNAYRMISSTSSGRHPAWHWCATRLHRLGSQTSLTCDHPLAASRDEESQVDQDRSPVLTATSARRAELSVNVGDGGRLAGTARLGQDMLRLRRSERMSVIDAQSMPPQSGNHFSEEQHAQLLGFDHLIRLD
jgi:hypothetical protein